MDLKEYLRMEIEGLDRGLKRVLDGLTQKEIEWQPACGCNSIGLILFHVFRAEDSFISQGKPALWETGKWYAKMGMDVKADGAHFSSPDQVNAFAVPKLAKILAYGAAVRRQTLAALNKMKPADFDKMVKMRFGDMPMAMIYSFVAGHANQHTGEMSYIRGIQRGLDK